MIDDSITITILDVVNGNVKIGIAAPKDILVHRLEVLARIRAGEAVPVPAE